MDATWMQTILMAMPLAREGLVRSRSGMPSCCWLLLEPLLTNFTFGTTYWTRNRFGSSISKAELCDYEYRASSHACLWSAFGCALSWYRLNVPVSFRVITFALGIPCDFVSASEAMLKNICKEITCFSPCTRIMMQWKQSRVNTIPVKC